MLAPARLLSAATAVPPFPLDQDDVIERVKLLFGGAHALDRLLPVFTNTGIRTRYSCVPMEWYDRPQSGAERTPLPPAPALALLKATTAQPLARPGRSRDEID